MDISTRWIIAGEIASRSALPERITALQAYEERNVPVEARRPFLGSVATIRQNQIIAAKALPQFDKWLSSAASGP
jgi:hypothetical protein